MNLEIISNFLDLDINVFKHLHWLVFSCVCEIYVNNWQHFFRIVKVNKKINGQN